MKRTTLVVALVLLAVSALVVAVLRPKATPEDIAVELSGTPGLSVTGKVTVDGVASLFSGTLPTNLAFRARSLSYRIKKGAEAGEFKATLGLPGGGHLTSTATAPFAGVEGAWRYVGWLWPRPVSYVTRLRKEEAP